MTRDPADFRAHHLDRGHQGECQDHGPEKIEAGLRARLAVSRDAGGVVVGGASDQSRPQLVEMRHPVQARGEPFFFFYIVHGLSRSRQVKISGTRPAVKVYYQWRFFLEAAL